jgi:protein-disulfide isomerase
MSKTFWIIVAVLIAGLVAFLFINNKNTENLNVSGEVSSIQESDHVLGPKDAKVVVIEYGDYQCPSCKAWQPKVEEFKAQLPADTAFVFRNFPITSIHKNAVASARAAEAVDLQGKFWEMNSLLYRNQTNWQSVDDPQSTFAGYAEELGLNIDQFNNDYQSSAVLDKINFDRDLATKQGVEATPTFFVNGQKLENANPSGDENPLTKAVQEAKQ